MGKAMKRLIKMHFQTKIEHDDHIDTHEFTTNGELYHKGNQDYLRFKESLSETDIVQTTMKWNGRELMLIRQGVILMRQAFVAEEKTNGRYVTPEASWETTAHTEKVLVEWPTGDKEGRIELVYEFELQGQHTGKHYVLLTLEEEITE